MQLGGRSSQRSYNPDDKHKKRFEGAKFRLECNFVFY